MDGFYIYIYIYIYKHTLCLHVILCVCLQNVQFIVNSLQPHHCVRLLCVVQIISPIQAGHTKYQAVCSEPGDFRVVKSEALPAWTEGKKKPRKRQANPDW